ncbi:MAG: choice-of-anchor J domain-containing protein [Prevotellaceae bacterium]|nr:choice-of-anchor J domain-containing protein [Prevotellaceae bacterium]
MLALLAGIGIASAQAFNPGQMLDEQFAVFPPKIPLTWSVSPETGYTYGQSGSQIVCPTWQSAQYMFSGMGLAVPKLDGDSLYAVFASGLLTNEDPFGSLITPALAPTAANHVLSFRIAELPIGTVDWISEVGPQLFVEISMDDGTTYIASTENVLTRLTGHNTFTDVPRFATTQIDLSGYVGQPIRVRFRGVSDYGGFMVGLDNIGGMPFNMPPTKLSVTQASFNTYKSVSLRQAGVLLPSALVTNTGADLVSPVSLAFTVSPGDYSKQVEVNNVSFGGANTFGVAAADAFTPATIGRYLLSASISATVANPNSQQDTTSVLITPRMLSSYNGALGASMGNTAHSIEFGTLYELTKPDVVSSLTLRFFLAQAGQFPSLSFGLAIYKFNPDSTLTLLYESKNYVREQGQQITKTYAIEPQYLEAGKYLFVAQQLTAQSLHLAADNTSGGTVFTVENGKAQPIYRNGYAAISVNTGQPTAVSPARNSEKISCTAPFSVSFLEGMSLSLATPATISVTDEQGNAVGGISASFAGNELAIAHDALSYNTTYTVTVPLSAMSGLWDEVKWSFTTEGNPSTCLAPSSLVASNITVDQLTLRWHENSAATSWELKYGARGFDPNAAGTSVTTGDNPYALIGMAENTKYEVYVRSLGCSNSNGYSDWSAPLRVKTLGRPITLYGIQNFDSDSASMSGGYYLSSLQSDNPQTIVHIKTSGVWHGLVGVYINGMYWAICNLELLKFDKDYNIISRSECATAVNSIAYDYSTGAIFGVTGTAASGGAGLLYKISVETGEILTSIPISPGMIALGCDLNGQVYGVTQVSGVAGTIYKIDKQTGATTPMGSTHLSPSIAGQALAFDYPSGRLFWGFYNNTIRSGNLIEIDLGEGEDFSFTDCGVLANGTSASLIFGLHTRFDYVKSTVPISGELFANNTAPIVAELDPQFCLAAGDLSAIRISPTVEMTPTLSGSTLSITLVKPLAYNTSYTVTIPKSAINGFPGDYSWTFKTAYDANGCYRVENVHVRNVGTHSATVSWDDYGRATSWQVRYGRRAFNPNLEGTTVEANTKTDFLLVGLPDARNLTVYVRSICGAGVYGAWSMLTDSANLHTQKDCTTPISQFPWTEGFENDTTLGCWSQMWNYEWQYEQTFSSSNNGEAPPYKGSKLLRMSTNQISGLYKFITPQLDISGLTGGNPVADFWYTAPSGDELRVYYKNTEHGVWHKLWESIAEVHEWTHVALNLPNGNDTYFLLFEENNKSGLGVSIDELSVRDFNLTDVRVVSLVAPTSSTQLSGAERVTVRLSNEGSATKANFNVSLELNGTLVATELVRMAIPSVGLYDYMFDAPINLSAFGSYNIRVYASLDGDENRSNDTLAVVVRNIDCRYSTLPWTENFEDLVTLSCFTSVNVSSSEYDEPQRSTTLRHSGAYSWRFSSASSSISTYPDFSQYFISPQMQPSVGKKYVEFYYRSSNTYDKLRLGYSTGDNSTSSFVWVDSILPTSSTANTWQRYFYHNIPSNALYVALCYYETNSGSLYLYVDDLTVGELFAHDIAALEITAPVSSPSLDSSERVTMLLQNVGSDSISSFTAKIYVNNSLLATETVDTILAPLEVAEYTFATTLDLSAYAVYQIRVELVLDNDGATSNNSAEVRVECFPCAITVSDGWTEGFEWTEVSDCWTILRNDYSGSSSQWKLNTSATYAHNSSKSMTHVHGGSITNDKLITPSITLPVGKAFQLTFWSYNHYASDYLSKGGRNCVLVSDSGDPLQDTAWTELWYAPTVLASWERTEISLAKYVGKTIRLAFKYQGSNAHDWYIDDLALQEISSPNATLIAVAHPAARSFDIGAERVAISITNNGSLPIDSFVISLDVDGQRYATDTVRQVNLGMGERFNYSFLKPYDFSAFRTYALQAELSMNEDNNPYDNTITAIVQNVSCRVKQLPWSTSFEGRLWNDIFSDCWTFIDHNIDGLNWDVGINDTAAHSGTNFMYSESYTVGLGDEGFDVTPDNWLVLPPIALPAANAAELKFWVGSAESGPIFFREHYDVWISTTGNSYENFTDSIWGETLDTAAWREITLSLDKYKGQIIYIAFVHNKCRGQFGLILDDVSVTELHPVNATLAGFHGIAQVEYGNAQTVKVALENSGVSPITTATISWWLDSVQQASKAWSGYLERGQKTVVTLASDVPMTNGNHSLLATLNMAGDGLALDDTARLNIEVRTAKTLPYETQFQGNFDEWSETSILGGVHWLWAIENYTYIPLSSETKSNGYALYDLIRNGNGGPSNALSALVSPGFDFSSLAPNQAFGMTFTHWVRNLYTTTIKLQASTDNFTDDITDLWTWTSSTAQEVLQGVQRVNLSSLAGEKHVRLRFWHNGNEAYGWAIDDIKIFVPTHSNDLSVLSVGALPTLNVTGDTAQFNATIINLGGDTQTDVPVTFAVNGESIVAHIPSIAYYDEVSVSVSWTSMAGAHTVTASLPNDNDDGNNALSFAKYVAAPHQLHDGFEDIANTVGWANDGQWAIMDANEDENYAAYVYEGSRACVAGAVNLAAYNNAMLVTPLLTIQSGDWIAFYACYLNTATDAIPTLQLMYNTTTADTGWLPISEQVMLTGTFKDYKFDLNIEGSYHLGIFATGSLNSAGRPLFTAVDHVIGPTLTEYYDVIFNVRDEQNNLLTGATVTFNEQASPTNTYVVEHQLPGSYAYAVAKSGYATDSGTLTIIDRNITLDITLRKLAYTVTFEVLDLATNAPITDALLTFNNLAQPAAGMYTINDVLAGTYAYSVSKQGYTPQSDNVVVSTADLTVPVLLAALNTGLGSETLALAVFPNPATTLLTITNAQLQAGDRIEVYNLNGTLVAAYTAAGKSATISLANLPQGNYIVKVGNRIAKIVKQ